MIEDAKLRELFKAESEEHLQHLDDALLRLEKTPADQALLEEAFREAHSLKGAARMLGLTGIQTPAHRLEDELNAARRGALPLSAEMIARMLVSLAEIRRLALEAVAGQSAKAQGATPSHTVIRESTSAPLAASAAPPGAGMPPAEPEPAPPERGPVPSAPYRIESVRVDTRKLDALMTHAGELTVTKTRIARRIADIDALIDFAEEWARREAARPPGMSAADAGATLERLARMGALLDCLQRLI